MSMLNHFFDYKPEVLALDEKAMELCQPYFHHMEEIRDYNQLKMLKAFADTQMSSTDMLGTTGYGLWDTGRAKLEQIFAEVMGAEDALVRSQFQSGTHTLAVALFGLLRAGDTLLAATGRTHLSMISQLVGAVVNIILDPIFIFGYCGEALSGTTGAAVATVIGQFCGAGMTLFFNLNKNPDIQISFKGFRPSAKAIGRIYTVGLPSIAMQCVGSLMTFGMNLILMAFSSTAVAVFGVYFKLQSFVFMPIFGLNNGMVPIISYNYGARRPERVKKTIRLAVCYAEGIMVLGFCIFEFFPGQVLGLFSASQAMLTIGIPAMRIICLHFLLAGTSIVLSSVFQALGNGVFSLIVSVCRQLFVLLPAAWLLAQTGNVNNVWWAFLIAEIVSVLMSLAFYAHINKTIIVPLCGPAEP